MYSFHRTLLWDCFVFIESQERAEQQILTGGSTERRENCPRVPASLSVPRPVHTERQTLTACTLFNRSWHY